MVMCTQEYFVTIYFTINQLNSSTWESLPVFSGHQLSDRILEYMNLYHGISGEVRKFAIRAVNLTGGTFFDIDCSVHCSFHSNITSRGMPSTHFRPSWFFLPISLVNLLKLWIVKRKSIRFVQRIAIVLPWNDSNGYTEYIAATPAVSLSGPSWAQFFPGEAASLL